MGPEWGRTRGDASSRTGMQRSWETGLSHSEVCSGPWPPPVHCHTQLHMVTGTRVIFFLGSWALSASHQPIWRGLGLEPTKSAGSFLAGGCSALP